MWNPNQQYNYSSGGYHQSSNYSSNYGGSKSSMANYNRPAVSGGSGYSSSTNPRVFTGHVTKLQDSFGIIDRDVFFQFSVVKGKVPQLNDKVLVEAVFNDVLPFKWHATSVQGLGQSGGGGGSNYTSRGSSSAVSKSSNGSSYNQGTSDHAGGRSSGSAAGSYRSSQQEYSKDSRYNSRYGNSPDKTYSSSSYRNSSSGYDSRSSMGRRDATYDFNSGRGDSGRSLKPASNSSSGGTDSRGYRYRDSRDDKRSSPPRGRGLSPESKHSSRDIYERPAKQVRPAARSRTPQRDKSNDTSRSYHSRKRSRSRSPKSGSRSHPMKVRESSHSSSHNRDRVSRDRGAGDSFKRVSLRYNVKPPRYPLNVNGVDTSELRRRFDGISIPANFAHLKFSYQQTFPLGKKFLGLGHLVRYHVMEPSAEKPVELTHAQKITSERPEDADSSHFVSVMLMGSQSLDYLYANCCRMSGSSSENLQHMSKVVSFLMAQKSNKDLCLVGGEWSPSLDGNDPRNDPAVLINTAIRVTQAHTGIDLSLCGNWYTIAELFFVKPGDKVNDEPDRLQRRVIFVPDIWNLMPNKVEWDRLRDIYKQCGESKAQELEPEPEPQQQQPETMESSAVADVNEQIFDKVMGESNEDASGAAADSDMMNPAVVSIDKEADVSAHSQLVPASMKVAELKAELASRGLDTKGLKNALVQRLEEALEKENSLNENANQTEMAAEEKETEDPIAEEVEMEAEEHCDMGGDEEVQETEVGPDSTVNDSATTFDEVTLQPDETEDLEEDVTEKDCEEGGAKGVSEFLKEEERRQKEEAERLAREIREEKERKEREAAEAARAKEEAERLEKERKEKEEQERAEKERKQKQEQIRMMYELPDKPHIVVHPPKESSGSAKLKSVSYSSLLDKVYAETREDAFTLEVFAECFYEMLQRDFCYEIYRALEQAKDPEVEKKRAEIARRLKEEAEAAEKARLEEEERKKKEEEDRLKKEAEEKAVTNQEKMDESNEAAEENGSMAEKCPSADAEEEVKKKEAEEEEEAVNKEEEFVAPPSKRLKSDSEVKGEESDVKVERKQEVKKDGAIDQQDSSEDKEVEEVVVKKKLVAKTVYPQLLLAFSFFDRSFSGYIKQRDLEECVDSLGLGLSKNQVKYLVGKVAKLDLVNYQDLTDERIEQGADFAFKYHTEQPLGNLEAYQPQTDAVQSSSGVSVAGDFVQFQGSTVNLKNVMSQSQQIQEQNDVLKSRVVDLEKDNNGLKLKFDNEALESASLRKKLGDTKALLATTSNTNSHLNKTQDSLKKLLKDNAFVLESTVKTINKKLVELEPQEDSKTPVEEAINP